MADRPRDRRFGQNLVLLDPRLAPVLFVDILERGFSQQLAWENHHANEPRGPVGGRLRENRIRTAFIPRSTRPIGSRGALRIDANTAFDQTSDTRPTVPMQ